MTADRPDEGADDLRPGGLAVRPGLLGPILLTTAAWVFLCTLHRPEDGLWFPADSPRHLANGAFYQDYFGAGMPSPIAFSRIYLLRYPIICPGKYPPFFYVLEAMAFTVFGRSALVAEGLVLAFALFVGFYQVAWLRRFVGPASAYFAPVVLLLPCIVKFSHAIMLNLPCLALQLASLYHYRCWIERPQRRQFGLALGFGLLASMTYQGAITSALVAVVWTALSGSWRRFVPSLRFALILVLASIVGAAILAWQLPAHPQVRWLVDTPWVWYYQNWLWYPRKAPLSFGPILLVLAAAGLAVGVGRRSRRPEAIMSGSWIAVFYLFHSYLDGKDTRYLMPLATPLLSLAAVACMTVVRVVRARVGDRAAAITFAAIVASLLIGYGRETRRLVLADVTGTQPIVEAVGRLGGPGEQSVLMCTSDVNSSLLVCRMMTATDPSRFRGLPATWLFDFAGVDDPADLRDYGETESQGARQILASSNCRWVVIPGNGPWFRPDLRLPLVEALSEGGFTKVLSARLDSVEPSLLELYRQDGPISGLSDLERPASRSSAMNWLLRKP